ncbi:MAG: TIGR04076 family protein [Desulfobacteraceae bacterium]|nr:TIGR04076 family protein [Desulfobacteraceae bacterium]
MGKIDYEIELEIYEGKGCEVHKKGEKFKYPEETGKICPWLLDSINTMIRVLQFGGSLPWKYQGTPYEKMSDPEGTTTEFVRCPDPTSAGVVVKIIRTKLPAPKDVGWA